MPLVATLQQPGWRDIRTAFRLYFETDFCSPVGVFRDGELIGVGSAIRFSGSAWLGHIITHADHRRQGVGSAIMAHLLDDLERRGIQTVTLFATEEGVPLYESFGFREAGRYNYYTISTPLPEPESDGMIIDAAPSDYDAILRLDLLVSGERRERLLRSHCSRARVVREGGSILGVWHPDIGEGLVQARDVDAGGVLLRARVAGAARCVVPAVNKAAQDYLERLGFAYSRSAPRMQRGPSTDWRPELHYSRISGNLG
jgi:GNAT superfamily N-acetyltransferase